MVKTRTNKRKKGLQEEEKENISDDVTVEHANGDNCICSFPNVSFLKISVKVTKTNKATATMKAKFQEMTKCIREADPTASISHFRIDPTPNDDGMFTAQSNVLVTNPESIPDSITAMGKFFHGCRPRAEGGVIWTQIRLMHTEPMDNIIADTRVELREIEGFISIQPLQHWDVMTIGFLKNLHPDVDNDNMQQFLIEEVNKIYSGEEELLLGIKVRTPYDGTKRDPNKQFKFKDRVQAYHVDTIGHMQETVHKHLKIVLAGMEFAERYAAPVRLVPPYDRRSSPNTQEKVKRCILQHSQFCQSVASLPCQGISSLAHYNKPLKGTMRDLIMSLPNSHFINIDMNWSNTNHVILFPRKYEEVAKEKVVHLAAFLHREYGDKILRSFEASTQQIVKETTWDENDRPISKLDRELDEMIAEDDKIDYVDTSFFAEIETPTTKPSDTFDPKVTAEAPMPFIPLVDDTSVSTFGTSPAKSYMPSNNTTTTGSVTSEVSMVSVLSRVSKVEENMDVMKNLLQKLVTAQEADSKAPAQRSSSSKAGGSNDPAAKGV